LLHSFGHAFFLVVASAFVADGEGAQAWYERGDTEPIRTTKEQRNEHEQTSGGVIHLHFTPTLHYSFPF
jgi:hypothetical protein